MDVFLGYQSAEGDSQKHRTHTAGETGVRSRGYRFPTIPSVLSDAVNWAHSLSPPVGFTFAGRSSIDRAG